MVVLDEVGFALTIAAASFLAFNIFYSRRIGQKDIAESVLKRPK